MGSILKFFLSKSKKGLWLIAAGLLTISSVNAAVIEINDSRTTTVDFNGTADDLNITTTGSISVDNNDTSVHTDELNGHFINNDGNVSTTVESWSDSNATAAGIFINNDNGNSNVADSNITNNGNITATAVGHNVDAKAGGIAIIDGNVTNSNITNNESITATAESNGSEADAYGIYNEDEVTGSNIENSGTITSTAESNSSNAEADGIYNYYVITDSNITNSRTITSTAESNSSEAYAYGIYNDDEVTGSNITNSGTITASAESNSSSDIAKAAGIYNAGHINHSNITTKDINLTATGKNKAYTYGIYIGSDSNDSNITNIGNLTATSHSSDSEAGSWGIFVHGNLNDSNIINSSNINIAANSDNNKSFAYGITSNDLNNSSIINSGNIILESNGSEAYSNGIRVYNVTNSRIENHKTIDVSANGSTASAYGINTDDFNNSTLINSGTITAKINSNLDKQGYSIYVFNSNANSTITNTETGKLYGKIYIAGQAKVINKGLIALPYNVMISDGSNAYIGGDLNNSGTIQIGMLTDGNISNTQYSQLRVKGHAVFNAGSVLDVNVLAASTNTKLLIGETLSKVIFSDNNITVNELSVIDNSRLLDFEYILNGNQIDLNITKGLTILDSTIQGGGNENAQAAARVLDQINENTPPNSMQKFYEALNTLGTDEEIAKAVDDTVPYNAISNIDLSNAVLDGIYGVIGNEGGAGLNSGDALFREKRLWVKPFGNFGKQKDKDSIHGFDFNTAGIGIGAEGEYSDNAYAGIGLFYNRANVDVNGVDQSSDLDIYTALLYGQAPIIDEATRFKYKASISWQNTDTDRYIALTNETAKSSYTSNLYAIDLRVERDTNINNNNLLLVPMIGATYRYIHTPSYAESGSSVDLSVDSSSTKRLTAYLGSKAYYQLDETSTLNGKVNVGYDVSHDDIAIVSAFSASPNNKFTTKGIDNGRWSYSASIGYQKHISNQDDINIRYEYYGEGSSFYNNSFFLNFMHRF